MDYAIIGAGALGSSIAKQFVRIGKSVALANSKGPESLAVLVKTLGSSVIATPIGEARLAKIVILATPFEAASDALAGVADWEGRILVDATNAIDYSDFSPLDLGDRSSTDVVGSYAPGARTVKAFNHVWARVLGRDPHVAGVGRRVMFLSGDEPMSKAEVSALIEEMGFSAIDLGTVDKGGVLAAFGGPLTTISLVSQPIGGATPPEMDVLDA
jgi:predicted dinucleotide-binding enzyme